MNKKLRFCALLMAGAVNFQAPLQAIDFGEVAFKAKALLVYGAAFLGASYFTTFCHESGHYIVDYVLGQRPTMHLSLDPLFDKNRVLSSDGLPNDCQKNKIINCIGLAMGPLAGIVACTALLAHSNAFSNVINNCGISDKKVCDFMVTTVANGVLCRQILNLIPSGNGRQDGQKIMNIMLQDVSNGVYVDRAQNWAQKMNMPVQLLFVGALFGPCFYHLLKK